ncbi:hypothetical protein MUN81_06510 [Hymenobacter sp. 5317J-9]|uniref:hypothetical protein n=1 Tax=Hymenobacter sp. 5317J-9 TaxID=2932250 RepID=UPI001FD6FDCA|nr:hypothetical protein [Hymenobacter sp. 5317J-9]UOQ99140.1 hypothetical protein MUN81_06510 [Hymenobacter sp. 5317J-9]
MPKGRKIGVAGVAGQCIEGVQVVAAVFLNQAKESPQGAGAEAPPGGGSVLLQLQLQGIAVAGVAQGLAKAGRHGLAERSLQGRGEARHGRWMVYAKKKIFLTFALPCGASGYLKSYFTSPFYVEQVLQTRPPSAGRCL